MFLFSSALYAVGQPACITTLGLSNSLTSLKPVPAKLPGKMCHDLVRTVVSRLLSEARWGKKSSRTGSVPVSDRDHVHASHMEKCFVHSSRGGLREGLLLVLFYM